MYHSQDDDITQSKLLCKLCWTTIVCFWAGLPFFLSHGICANNVLPALGLVPMAASQVTSIYRLFKLHKKDSLEYQIILGDEQRRDADKEHFAGFLALLDIAIVILEIVVFVLTCVITFARRYSFGQALAAYATVFLFVDTGIHIYLFIKYISSRSWTFKKHNCATSCPNCRVAREAAESSNPHYRDMAESTPRESGNTPSGPASSA